MNQSNTKDFTFEFETSKASEEIFKILLDVRSWWMGLYSENISGNSDKVNDEFTFHAGDGVHYSKQKLVELIPGKKIVWLVMESNLSFLKKTDEWTGTKICFEINTDKNSTKVRFTHIGLVPKIECYKDCSGAWTQYLQKLAYTYK